MGQTQDKNGTNQAQNGTKDQDKNGTVQDKSGTKDQDKNGTKNKGGPSENRGTLGYL